VADVPHREADALEGLNPVAEAPISPSVRTIAPLG